MNTTAWHMDSDLADAYAAGRVGPVLAASVEQHLLRCEACRALLPVDRPRLDAVWSEVVERVLEPRRSLLERLLGRLGLDEGTSRLVAATPSLRGAWLTGVVVVLCLAVMAAHSDENGVAVFMALAPVLPVAGVALVFGPKADPAHEIVAATPYSALHLLAVRTAFVVGTTMVPAALLSPFLPGGGLIALAWLVPALALTGATLILATWLAPHVAAVGLGAAWVSVVLPGLAHHRDPLLAAHPAVQLLSVAALAASALVLLTHRHELPEIIRRNP
jgi:hypothetical protein